MSYSDVCMCVRAFVRAGAGDFLESMCCAAATMPSTSASGSSDFDMAKKLQETEYGGAAPSAAAGGAVSIRHFTLYHYNGLEDPGRQPACVPLYVSQPDESSDLMDSVSATSDADIAILSVVRTKWPGASLDFRGKPAPKLD
jgi:hypothetical protein